MSHGANSPPPEVGADAGVRFAGELPTVPGPNSVLPGGAGEGGGDEAVAEGGGLVDASFEERWRDSGVRVGRTAARGGGRFLLCASCRWLAVGADGRGV